MFPEVADTIYQALRHGYANASSQHAAGRSARRALEEAREGIANFFGMNVANSGDGLILTSGGTEANNLAVYSLAGDKPGRIIISAIEHPSVSAPVAELARQGWEVCVAPVAESGVVAIERLQELLSADTRMVSIMLANNETGVIQPIEEISRICAGRNVPMHVDGIQAVGRIPIDFLAFNVATMAVSCHKCHGPKGIGALLTRHDVTLRPITIGGSQQLEMRAGTEPVALALGMRMSLELCQQRAEASTARMRRLRDKLEQSLLSGDPATIIHGIQANRLPQTTNIAFRGLDRQALLMALDLAGVACSSGSACASGSSEPSTVLKAMGLPPGIVDSSLRISLGATTTESEIDLAADRILSVTRNLRKSK